MRRWNLGIFAVLHLLRNALDLTEHSGVPHTVARVLEHMICFVTKLKWHQTFWYIYLMTVVLILNVSGHDG